MCLASRHLLTFALLGLAACAADTKTFERREVVVSTAAVLGRPAGATASGAVSQDKPCSLEGGEFGAHWDCTDYRPLDATMLSLTCSPAEACADIQLERATAKFLPLAESFEVHALADFEGVRVEKTETVRAVAPAIQFGDFGNGPDGLPLIHFERSTVRVCPSGASVVVTASQDGSPLVAEAEWAPPPAPPCWRIVTKSGADVHAEVRLARPDRLLTTRIETLVPLSAVTRIAARDTYCGLEGITAIPSAQSRYVLRVEVRAFTARGSGLLPAFTSRVENAGVAVTPSAPASESHYFTFEGAPAQGAELVIEAGARTLRLPVRARAEACPPPLPE